MQLEWWYFGDPETALMLMDQAHLTDHALIVRVLKKTRERTTKIREV